MVYPRPLAIALMALALASTAGADGTEALGTPSIAIASGTGIAAGGTGLLPDDDAATAILLDVLLLQKATYELRYELGARPDWVTIPLRGLDAILDDEPGA